MAKTIRHNLDEVIEVVMKKKMTTKEYYNMRSGAIKKGWSCQGYELEYFKGDKGRTEVK